MLYQLVSHLKSSQVIKDSTRDDPDRSNHLLKRTAPQCKKSSTLQAKKSKTSSVARDVLPQRVSQRPFPQSPPKSFEEANALVVEAWKVMFPGLRFPTELIGVFPKQQRMVFETYSLETVMLSLMSLTGTTLCTTCIS
jgi:hypothetical protein